MLKSPLRAGDWESKVRFSRSTGRNQPSRLKVRRLACVLLAALWTASGAVHAERLPFKRYTTAGGLAHDRVKRIFRDSRGFLWFCTVDGLSRFDGYRFVTFTTAHDLPHAI